MNEFKSPQSTITPCFVAYFLVFFNVYNLRRLRENINSEVIEDFVGGATSAGRGSTGSRLSKVNPESDYSIPESIAQDEQIVT